MSSPRTLSGKTVFLLLLPILAYYAGMMAQKNQIPLDTEDLPSEEFLIPISYTEQSPEINRAELVMKALAAAYPGRVGSAEFRDGDWAVPLAGKWYYYAEGRILPEERKDQVSQYSALPFYNYIAELPEWTPPSPELAARMSDPRRSVSNRPSYFFDDLWRSRDQDEAWDRTKTIYFLNHRVMVHQGILMPLSLVEEQILKEARTSSAVRQWIDSLDTVVSWGWRNIASSENRSFHSYGIAIDILPRVTRGQEVYWLWTSQYNPEWWNVPYSRRYHPPDEVIRAFESFGFIWGGKWLTYDTMHFEYRPEVLILNDIPMADLRSLP